MIEAPTDYVAQAKEAVGRLCLSPRQPAHSGVVVLGYYDALAEQLGTYAARATHLNTDCPKCGAVVRLVG